MVVGCGVEDNNRPPITGNAHHSRFFTLCIRILDVWNNRTNNSKNFLGHVNKAESELRIFLSYTYLSVSLFQSSLLYKSAKNSTGNI